MARPLGASAAALVLLLALPTASGCAARDFVVGDSDGWTANPAVPYNHWAERNRFHVNDTLVFRYNKDVDAVLLVTQRHYDACNTTEPFLRLDGGDARITFRDSGQFFFISADAGRCLAGERLNVFVHPWRTTPPSAPPHPSQKQASPPPPKQASSSLAAPAPSSPTQPELPAPLTAPVTGIKNEAGSPSKSSSAVASRACVHLACFLIAHNGLSNRVGASYYFISAGIRKIVTCFGDTMASPFGVITLSLLLLLLTASSGAGIDYYVGGSRNGWTINPAKPLSFQINDALVFRYDKAVDAALRVSQSHYNACNATEPLLRLDGGHPRFVFRVSDFHYFISADARRCREGGERLIAVVLHPHNNTPSPPKSASTSALPPTSGNDTSPLPLPPPPPPKSVSTSAPHPAPPKPASPSTKPSPPPQSVLPPSSPPYPSSAGNASSPSSRPLTTAPVPGTNHGTGPPSTHSSAVALRAGVLAVQGRGRGAVGKPEPLRRLQHHRALPPPRLADSDSPFLRLNNPGSSYCFISADARRCRDGERLIAIVLNPPHNKTPSSPKSESQSALPPTSPPPPVPGTKKGTGPPSTSSSAVALRAGVLACLLVGASAAIL
ncbi:hypothetical protein EJB05_32491, partial [Eragrostis curvula]